MEEREFRSFDPRQLDFPKPLRTPLSYLLLARQMFVSWVICFVSSFIMEIAVRPLLPEMVKGTFPVHETRFGVFIVSGLVTLVFGILSLIYQMKLLYRYWLLLQDGYAQTTPGKAVGFLFIPFFNFYWIFVTYYGLAVDMNAYARRHQMEIPPVNEKKLFLACVLMLIPYINTLGAILLVMMMASLAPTAAALQAKRNSKVS